MNPSNEEKATNRKPMEGMRFGRLLVLSLAGKNCRRELLWFCECDCGERVIANGKSLRKLNAQSCGCYSVDRTKESNGTHGMTGTRIYRIWTGMLNRCRNTNDKDYHYWGGRGISVCDRWLTFENFYSDMGEPPTDEHSIDRINNDGNYEPDNVRWATHDQQANNRRPPDVYTEEKELLVHKVYELRNSGMSYQKIADATGISKRHVGRIDKRKVEWIERELLQQSDEEQP